MHKFRVGDYVKLINDHSITSSGFITEFNMNVSISKRYWIKFDIGEYLYNENEIELDKITLRDDKLISLFKNKY